MESFWSLSLHFIFQKMKTTVIKEDVLGLLIVQHVPIVQDAVIVELEELVEFVAEVHRNGVFTAHHQAKKVKAQRKVPIVLLQKRQA